MRRFFSFLLFAVALVVPVPTPSIAAGLTTFTIESEAQKHCTADIVVWLNLPTGAYHFKGRRWYGATKNGAYVS